MPQTENTAETATTGEAAAPATTTEVRKRAEPTNFLPIVRGRLPLLFVHAIRFDKVLNVMQNKDLAAKFATSVGKVFDIKKGRNFSYVTEGFKPSAEDVAAAEAWIAQVGGANAKGLTANGDRDLMQKTLDEYKQRGLASAEEAAAFSAARTATRVPATPAAKTSGGANPAPAAQVQAAAAGSSDDLLS